MRVDKAITNFQRTDHQLQEFVLFSVLVANSSAKAAARFLARLFDLCPRRKRTPFSKIRGAIAATQDWTSPSLRELMRHVGIGKHGVKSRAFTELVRSNLNLRTCTRADLMQIHGIKWKTASFFLLHSREKAWVASLDVHVLRWMRENIPHDPGFIPKQTPTGAKYLMVERLFLDYAVAHELHPAELDFEIWQAGSEKRTPDFSNVSPLQT